MSEESSSAGSSPANRAPVAIDVTPPDALALAWKELSDLGNAERLVDRYGGKLLYVDGRGWSAWTGTHWSHEKGEQLAHKAAHGVARSIREEIAALKAAIEDRKLPPGITEQIASDRLVNLRKWAVTSGNANKTAAMLSQASNLMMVWRDDFDSEPLALNVLNGTLRAVQERPGAPPPGQPDVPGRWRVRLDPHDPHDRISRVAEVAFDPEASCPTWDERLKVVLPDPSVRSFFRQCVGYALTGLTREQCIFLLQGRGGDGKSTTMDELRAMLGGYASAADVQTFMAGAVRSGADASPDLARLAGDMRLCSTGEPRRGGALDEAKIKAITGGSPIAARELHGDLFEYVPGFKLFLECNAKPRISGDDDGIWRRIVVIMFPHQFDKKDPPDKAIKDKLAAERPGILNWAIQGMLEWLDAGELAPPSAVIEAVEDYRRAANPFGEWLSERVDTSDPTALVLSSALYGDYKDWCEAQGVADREVMTSAAFGRALGDRQILKGPKDGKGLIQRRGARLRDGYAPAQSAASRDLADRPFAPPDYGGDDEDVP